MAQLIVALDYTNAEDALATAESLRQQRKESKP